MQWERGSHRDTERNDARREKSFCAPSDGKEGLGWGPQPLCWGGHGRPSPHWDAPWASCAPGEFGLGRKQPAVSPHHLGRPRDVTHPPVVPAPSPHARLGILWQSWGGGGGPGPRQLPKSRAHQHVPPVHPGEGGGADPGSLPAHLGKRQDDEGPPTAGLDDDGHKLGVDGTEGAVTRHLGDTNVLVHLVSLHRLPEDVPELALAHHAAAHGWGVQGQATTPTLLQHGGVLAPLRPCAPRHPPLPWTQREAWGHGDDEGCRMVPDVVPTPWQGPGVALGCGGGERALQVLGTGIPVPEPLDGWAGTRPCHDAQPCRAPRLCRAAWLAPGLAPQRLQ